MLFFATAGGAAANPDWRTYTDDRVGLSLRVPPGWDIVHRRLTPCVNPIERLTVAGRGALVMLQEALDPRRYIGRFAPRPRRSGLRAKPQPIACCAPSRRPGWFFNFREGGRGFYVYLGGPATRSDALAILDSLRVRPRRQWGSQSSR